MKILLVEDDAKLGQATMQLLEYEGCSCDWATTGTEALEDVRTGQSNCYDVILLDWMLPELSGLEVCNILRQKYGFQGGIIFVTAKGEEEDCVRALDRGADDYVVKPFRIKELIARIKAVSRRKGKPFIDKIYRNRSFAINRDLQQISADNRRLRLRRKEFALFELLFVNLGNILPREVIFEKIWGDNLETNMESLDSHIYSLRKNLKDVFPEIQVKLAKNIGYMMEINDHD